MWRLVGKVRLDSNLSWNRLRAQLTLKDQQRFILGYIFISVVEFLFTSQVQGLIRQLLSFSFIQFYLA